MKIFYSCTEFQIIFFTYIAVKLYILKKHLNRVFFQCFQNGLFKTPKLSGTLASSTKHGCISWTQSWSPTIHPFSSKEPFINNVGNWEGGGRGGSGQKGGY